MRLAERCPWLPIGRTGPLCSVGVGQATPHLFVKQNALLRIHHLRAAQEALQRSTLGCEVKKQEKMRRVRLGALPPAMNRAKAKSRFLGQGLPSETQRLPQPLEAAREVAGKSRAV